MTYAPKLPTIKENVNVILSDYSARTQKKISLLKKSVIKALAYSFSGCNYLNWKYLSWQFLQVFPQTASLPFLKMWGYIVNADYQYGKCTILKLQADGVTASNILTGTVYKHIESGNIYTVVSTATPINNICTFNVIAKKTGVQGLIDIGETLEITNPFDGIPSKAKVIDIVEEGTNDEDIEIYRIRVLNRFRRKPQGGSFQDYKDWALEAAGISDALPYCLTEGTVTIFLVASGSGKNRSPSGSISPNPFPEWVDGQMKILSGSGHFYNAASLINGVDEFKNTRRPVTAKVQLLAPNYSGFKIKIVGLTPNTNEVVKSIKKSIIEYLDVKRPHIIAIGYNEQNSLINSNQINAIVQNIVDGYEGSYTSFKLYDLSDNEIEKANLGIGELAYLQSLMINGSEIDL